MEKLRLVDYWQKSGIITDKRLLKAFEEVPRELFIKDGFEEEAYYDHPLPIGHSQTISQPTTVMLMTQALELKQGEKVLEVGAGSGYQAALIAKIIGSKGKVITTEIIPELVEFAKENLRKAKIKNVEIINYDGSQGYKKEAPYNKIIITAACPRIPPPIIKQTKRMGIIVAPVDSLAIGQEMTRLRKRRHGVEQESLGRFVFVPLKGKYGY